MADDVELDIGVNLDETKFTSSFQNFLTSLKTETAVALEDALNHVKGSAAKNWGSLPYQTFHTQDGAGYASKAFVPGFAADLKDLGIKKNSTFYEASLLSAAYRSSVPDPQHRANLLQSYGRNAPTPDSNIERVLNTDYELLSMPWSRAFIRQSRNGTVKANFADMREYAVEQGVGRWIDPEEEHKADNFELIEEALRSTDKSEKNQATDNFEFINDTLEDINDNSEKSEKVFRGWNDTLKSVLGTLTAIGGSTAISGTLKAVYTKSEKETTEAGTTLPRTRAYLGMTPVDVLETKVAGRAVGLGEDTVYSEISTMSNAREKYKLLGQGLDALFPSLSGIFDNIMSGEDPYEVYKGIIKELYTQLKGADRDTRSRALMLMHEQGLGAAADIVGTYLEHPEMGDDPTKLFSLTDNPYYGVYKSAETLLPDITKLNQSLDASYKEIYKTFETAFGLPFKGWWDDVMKEKVVPWFQKFADLFGKEEESPAEAEAGDAMLEAGMAVIATDKDRKQTIENQSGTLKLSQGDWSFKVHELPFKTLNQWASQDYSQNKGEVFKAAWGRMEDILDYSPADISKSFNKNKDLTKEQKAASIKAALDTQSRLQYMRDRLDDTGLLSFITNRKTEDVDKLIMLSVQQGLYGGENWQEQFDSFIENALKVGSSGSNMDEAILEALNKIVNNTEAAKSLLDEKDFWVMVANAVGTDKANEIRDNVANRAY